MSEFKQDTEFTPVLFRAERSGPFKGVVDAVFPTLPADLDKYTMTCYAHIGQHSGCSLEWYHTTRKATPAEYADLKAELESAPYGYRLKVYQRMTRDLRDQFNAEMRRLRMT